MVLFPTAVALCKFSDVQTSAYLSGKTGGHFNINS
jgi:hypothetical protein